MDGIKRLEKMHEEAMKRCEAERDKVKEMEAKLERSEDEIIKLRFTALTVPAVQAEGERLEREKRQLEQQLAEEKELRVKLEKEAKEKENGIKKIKDALAHFKKATAQSIETIQKTLEDKLDAQSTKMNALENKVKLVKSSVKKEKERLVKEVNTFKKGLDAANLTIRATHAAVGADIRSLTASQAFLVPTSVREDTPVVQSSTVQTPVAQKPLKQKCERKRPITDGETEVKEEEPEKERGSRKRGEPAPKRIKLKTATETEFYELWAVQVKKLDPNMTADKLKAMEENARFVLIDTLLKGATKVKTVGSYLKKFKSHYYKRFLSEKSLYTIWNAALSQTGLHSIPIAAFKHMNDEGRSAEIRQITSTLQPGSAKDDLMAELSLCADAYIARFAEFGSSGSK